MKGKVLREKQNMKDEWKQKIFKGIKGTGEALKSHANSVSNQIQKWWKGIRAAPAKKNSKTGKSEL